MGSGRLPLYEGENVPRVLVTGFDRMDQPDPGVYCFVGTVKASVSGQPERRVAIYLDVTPSAIIDGLLLVLAGATHLVRQAINQHLIALGLSPSLQPDMESDADGRHEARGPLH